MPNNKVKERWKIIKNDLPPGYFYVEDMETGRIYYAWINWPQLRPEQGPQILVERRVTVKNAIEIGAEGQTEKITYILEDGFYPPITPPVVKTIVKKEGEYNVVGEAELPEVDVDQLYEEILNYLKGHLWLRNEEEYHVLACWILATWVKELFDSYSYLAIIGPYESGKSRVLEVLSQLSYNSILAASASPAVIPRLIERYQATVLIDEGQLLKSKDRDELVAILNNGYRRGGVYVRAKREGEGEEVRRVDGFKAFAAPEDLVRSLQTRCLEINMMELPRPDRVRFTIDLEEARRLRAELLAFRFKMLRRSDGVDQEELARSLYREGITKRRLCEIGAPLYFVCPDKYKHFLIKYLKDLSEKKKSEKYTSLEATIIAAIVKLGEESPGPKLAVSRITEKVNEMLELDEKHKYDPRTIGRKLSSLNFKKTRLNDGRMAIIYDKRLIRDLAQRYGVEVPLTGTEETEVSEVSTEIGLTSKSSIFSLFSIPPSPFQLSVFESADL